MPNTLRCKENHENAALPVPLIIFSSCDHVGTQGGEIIPGDQSVNLGGERAPGATRYQFSTDYLSYAPDGSLIGKEQTIAVPSSQSSAVLNTGATRIFADLVIMTDAVRVAVHLKRKVDDPIFFNVGGDEKSVTHVARLKTADEFEAIKPFLKEAYECSLT